MSDGTTLEIWNRNELARARVDSASLVRCATLAASSHNTQPWKFRIERDRIIVLPDPSRRCPEVDPDDHHLFASLGCAAENLALAAQAAGRRASVSFDDTVPAVRIDFEPDEPRRTAQFDAIPRRQTSRVAFDGTQLSPQDLRALELAGRGAGVSAVLITDSARKGAVAEYVAAGNTAQFRDPHWAREMRTWIRFNAREARQTGDGLHGKVLGIPDLPRWLGKALMPLAASAVRQNRKDVECIRRSGAVVVLVSEIDDARHWVEAGRSCQRLMLEATALGLRSAFINQPVEVAALRSQFAGFLNIAQGRPDLVLRIGRGPEQPSSLRRPLEDVLLPEPASVGEDVERMLSRGSMASATRALART
jgi:nitroreductase